jgi:hypothetical protein
MSDTADHCLMAVFVALCVIEAVRFIRSRIEHRRALKRIADLDRTYDEADARAKLRGALYMIRNGAHAALVADLIDDGPPLPLPAAPPSAGETRTT